MYVSNMLMLMLMLTLFISILTTHRAMFTTSHATLFRFARLDTPTMFCSAPRSTTILITGASTFVSRPAFATAFRSAAAFICSSLHPTPPHPILNIKTHQVSKILIIKGPPIFKSQNNIWVINTPNKLIPHNDAFHNTTP